LRGLPWAVPAILVSALGAGMLVGAWVGAPLGPGPRGADQVAASSPPARAAKVTQPRVLDAAVVVATKPSVHRAVAGTDNRSVPAPATRTYTTVRGETIDPGRAVTAAIAAHLPLPADSGKGRRIVYSGRSQHLWLVAADGSVVRDYPVTGRADRPRAGTYHVYSKSLTSFNPIAKVTFTHMVRFAYGITGASIGFHSIPKWYNGKPLQTTASLGLALGRGGCIRQSPQEAAFLYGWAGVGTTVVVVR
jgi:lipoprotein-anchoring transpeptidase ErfK/SrfK